MKKYARTAAFCAGLMAASTAWGGIVYDNGLPNQESGVEMTYWMHGDDINVTGSITFNVIRFWNLQPTATPSSYNGSIVWIVNDDADPFAPGYPAVAYQDSGVGFPTRTMTASITTGAFAGYDEYQNDFTLATPITLTTGQYWLVLHNGGYELDTDQSFYWATTDNNGSSNSYSFVRTPPGPWVENSLSAPVSEAQLAFQLLNEASAPEPGTWGLLAAGIAGLAAMRLRRAL